MPIEDPTGWKVIVPVRDQIVEHFDARRMFKIR
jgi:hypothetical protein